jgi:hypothetical protein
VGVQEVCVIGGCDGDLDVLGPRVVLGHMAVGAKVVAEDQDLMWGKLWWQ